jgi:hypothetical protein
MRLDAGGSLPDAATNPPDGGITIDAGCNGSTSNVSLDCNADAGCSQIQVNNDPVDSTHSSFYGNFDPCLRRDPNGPNTLYLTYSFPSVVAGGTGTPVIEIHLASSSDGGKTWSYQGRIWPHATANDGNQTTYEVSALAADDVGGVTTWYAISHHYEVPPGGKLQGEPLFTDSSYFVLASSNQATMLGSAQADTAILNFGGTTLSPSPSSPNLTTIAGDSTCTIWHEPAIIIQGGVFYLAAQCGTAGGGYGYYAVFAAPISGSMSTWSWKYLGKLFGDADAAHLLPSAGKAIITELDLSKRADGAVVAIMTVMDASKGQKYGSRTADVATLGNYLSGSPPAMVRDCSGSMIVTGQFTASDLNVSPNQGPDASTYEAADTNVGVLIVRRYMKPNIHGFIFRTGMFPE